DVRVRPDAVARMDLSAALSNGTSLQVLASRTGTRPDSLATLQGLEDLDDADGDGISGRLGRDPQGRPARFGRKGDVATLADFVDSAFRMEMGITTPRVPDEDRAGHPPGVPAPVDPAPEPEVSQDEFDAVVHFLRFLAPLAPAPVDDPEEIEGERRFHELGCARCHVPELPTAPFGSPGVPAGSIAIYSDLLLHDMGPGLEGTCTTGAANNEYRTEPLMGLRYRDRFLHDGRATRVMDAILAHGGEAEAARQAFSRLNRLQQETVLQFLRTR
ncbi:MAG: di-heme oxidoredictase family protein, partial [Longimicrobiales bacterium]|nr:di-heme oxidoredictase family protein [Longimicrobiales bacterium]